MRGMTGPGPLSVQVDVAGAGSLTSEPKKVLTERIESFANELFDQATTYEKRSRGNTSTQQQFTTAHISDAYIEVRRTGLKQSGKDQFWAFLTRLLLYLAAAGIGVGGNKLEEDWGIALFWSSLAVGLVMVIILEIRGWRGGES
ncbi:hypothetical protein [Blastococcus sp. SYSU DS0541]